MRTSTIVVSVIVVSVFAGCTPAPAPAPAPEAPPIPSECFMYHEHFVGFDYSVCPE